MCPEKHKRNVKYICVDPEGNEHETTNLTGFCREHELWPKTMRNIARGVKKGTCKGWTCRLAEEESKKPGNGSQVDSGAASIQPVEGFLVKLQYMVVDALSEEIDEFEEPVSIDGGTLGGKLLELHAIIEPGNDEHPEGQVTMASRIVQRAPMWEEEDKDLKPLEFIQEPNEEGVEYGDGEISEGWNVRRIESLNALWELKRPSTQGAFYEYLGELNEIIGDECMDAPAKLYNMVGSPWSTFETSEAPIDGLKAATEPDLLVNTLVVTYTPTFAPERYKPNPENPNVPFVLEDGSTPEWHDEVDTICIFEDYDLIEMP